MKRTFLFLSLLMTVISINAQTNKELLETITAQSQTIGELRANLTMKEQQLQEAKSTIAELQEENKRLKEQLQAPATTNVMTYRDSLLDLRQKFYACDTWQELLQYVMEPERVKPLMEKYYKVKPYTSEVLNNNVKITKYQGKKHTLYKVNKNWIVKTDQGYKIDWEATVRYNAVSIIDMRQQPGKVFEYRGDIRDSQQFNERPNCLEYFLGEESSAYPKKNSAIAKKMQELIPYDEWREMILKIKFLRINDADTIHPYDFEIVEIVSEFPSKY